MKFVNVCVFKVAKQFLFCLIVCWKYFGLMKHNRINDLLFILKKFCQSSCSSFRQIGKRLIVNSFWFSPSLPLF